MNYKAVERWTSKIDIFGYDYIIVPINESQYVKLHLTKISTDLSQGPLVLGNYLQCLEHPTQACTGRL